jgi:acetyl esterase/lipase
VIGARKRLLEIFVRRWIRAALDPSLAVDHQRRQVLRAARFLPKVRGVEVSSHRVGDRDALWLAPKDGDRGGALLYLHGGAYVLGSPRTHRNVGSRLARLTGLPVLIPDYRLAPGARCPAALIDARAAWSHLLECGLPPERIATAPAEPRDAARLLVVHRAGNTLSHHHVRDLPKLGLLRPISLWPWL